MGEIGVNGRTVLPERTYRSRTGVEAQAALAGAMASSPYDGADNLFYSLGEDVFVASGRGMDLEGVKRGDKVVVGDREGEVLGVDQETNTAGEGALDAAPPAGLMVLVSGFFFAFKAYVTGGFGLLLSAGLLGLGAKSGQDRKVNLDVMAEFAAAEPAL